ncbi:AAA family ATPase [Azospirillum sp.]|uniref:AAA family ATPase n=1 Tax=Azospirillum sp. TaxID=34012 RepID=UPI003D751203
MQGEDVKRLREQKGLLQAEFATWLNEALGRRYDGPKISRWEGNREKIPEAVLRFLLREQAGPNAKHGPAYIAACTNNKGGVGKTTTSVNLGSVLAAQGNRVLVIDADPQAHATANLGLDTPEYEQEVKKSLPHVLRDQVSLRDVIVPVRPAGLEVVPSCLGLSFVESELTSDSSGPLALREKIAELKDDYDFVIIDCPPNLGQMTTNALLSCHGVIIPTQTEYLASLGMEKLLASIAKIKRRFVSDFQILGILPTMHDVRLHQHQVVLEHLHTTFGQSLRIFPPIPRATVHGEAALAGRAAFEAEPEAPGAANMRVLIDALISEREKRLEVLNVA